jgi:hypothetical protein
LTAPPLTPYGTIPAGQTVILCTRYTYEHGAQDCQGIFRAVRDFDPTAEAAAYAEAFPQAGEPVNWTDDGRRNFIRWAVLDRRVLEEAVPTYLFLEPWPEKPAAADGTTEKVAHGD